MQKAKPDPARRSVQRYALLADIHATLPAKDGDWRAGYALIDVDAGGNIDGVFQRVEYEIGRAIAGIRASELPDELAEILRTGGVLEDSAGGSQGPHHTRSSAGSADGAHPPTAGAGRKDNTDQSRQPAEVDT